MNRPPLPHRHLDGDLPELPLSYAAQLVALGVLIGLAAAALLFGLTVRHP